MKKLLILLVLVGLILAGVASLVSRPWESWAAQRTDAVEFTTVPVEYGHLYETISGSGLVQPQQTLTISTESAGRVVRIYHDVGEEVQEGEPLLQFDDQVARMKLEQAEAAVATARTMVESARGTVAEAESRRAGARLALDRVLQIDPGSRTQEQVNQARTTLDVAEKGVQAARTTVQTAEARIHEAEAAVKLARLNCDLTLVRVPYVIHQGPRGRPNEVGQVLEKAPQNDRPLRKFTIIERKVALNQLVGPPLSSQLFVLADQDKKRVEVNALIAEGDIGKVAAGQEVQFKVMAYDNEFFTGEVSEIAELPTNLNGAISYTVKLEADNKKNAKGQWCLRPGMSTSSLDILVHRVPEKDDQKTWVVQTAALDFPLDRYYYPPTLHDKPTPPAGDQQLLWYLGPDPVHPAYTFVKVGAAGKVKDPQTGALRTDPYTQIEWVRPPQPTPDDTATYPNVIIGAPPPPKKGMLHLPGLIK